MQENYPCKIQIDWILRMLPTCGAQGHFCLMKSNLIAIKNLQGGAQFWGDANFEMVGECGEHWKGTRGLVFPEQYLWQDLLEH